MFRRNSDIDENQLREHCRAHLPSYMIPSIFIILDKLPLNANGKIDRKLLPAPNLSLLSLSSNEDQYIEPNGVLEMQVSFHMVVNFFSVHTFLPTQVSLALVDILILLHTIVSSL